MPAKFNLFLLFAQCWNLNTTEFILQTWNILPWQTFTWIYVVWIPLWHFQQVAVKLPLISEVLWFFFMVHKFRCVHWIQVKSKNQLPQIRLLRFRHWNPNSNTEDKQSSLNEIRPVRDQFLFCHWCDPISETLDTWMFEMCVCKP